MGRRFDPDYVSPTWGAYVAECIREGWDVITGPPQRKENTEPTEIRVAGLNDKVWILAIKPEAVWLSLKYPNGYSETAVHAVNPDRPSYDPDYIVTCSIWDPNGRNTHQATSGEFQSLAKHIITGYNRENYKRPNEEIIRRLKENALRY